MTAIVLTTARTTPTAAHSAGGGDSVDATQRVDVLGVVLCGGRSSRMGFDKGAAELAGTSLVARAAATLREATGSVVLACGAEPRHAELGLEVVLDDASLTGPVAGIVAALESASDEGRVLVLACDMPGVDGALLSKLIERARVEDLDACMLVSERGEEPLCSVYSRRLVPAWRAAQAAGRLRVTAFRDFDRADGERPRVGLVEVDAGGAPRNLNTPEELEAERRRWLEEERT